MIEKNTLQYLSLSGTDITVESIVKISNTNFTLIKNSFTYFLSMTLKGKSIDFKHTEAYQINFEGNKRKDVLFALKEINQYKKEKLFKS